MTRPDENLSIQINNYLQKIVTEDETNLVSKVYTELSAKEISPANLRLDGGVFEVFDLAEKEKNLIISGASGSGKTKTLEWLNFRYAEKYLKKGNCSVPVYIDLRFYNKGDFSKHIEIKANELGLAASEYKLLLQNKNILFLLDGLDLLSPKEGFVPFVEISNFISENCDCRFVISGRSGSFDEFGLKFKISKLEGLEEEEIKQFIDKYIQNEKGLSQTKKDALSKAIKEKIFKDRNEKLISLLSNPMVLHLAIQVALENPNEDEVLPSNRYELYKKFIEGFFGHVKKARGYIRANREQITGTLTDIFFRIQCLNQVSIENKYALEIAKKYSEDKRFMRENISAEGILKDIINLGLLKDDGASITYGIHQSFQEYFSALRLKEWYDKCYDVFPAFHHPKWEEVVLFTSEMFDCPDDFIRSIINSGELDLASKCAQNASNDVKEVLCIRLADKYDSRFQVDKIKAIESLGRLGELAITVIITGLCDEDKNVRMRAVSVLGKIKSEKSVEALIKALSDENKGVHANAAGALGKIKSERAVQALITELSDENKGVRMKAVGALGKIKSEKAVQALINVLSDENKDVCMKAVDVLGKIKTEKAVETLIAALSHEYIDVRMKAAYLLGEIKSEKAVDTLIALLSDKKKNVRRRAAGELREMKSEKAVEALIVALSDEYKDVRMNAAGALIEIKSKKAVDGLIAALSHEKEGVRMNAAGALGKIKSEIAMDALIAALSDEKVNVRWKAALALSKLKSEKAVEVLIAALSDENDDVRINAVGALGEIKSEKVVDALIVALSDENKGVRMHAADALGEFKSEKAVGALITVLRDENKDVRRKAAVALGEIKSEKAVEALIAALSDENKIVRWNAVGALGEIKSEKAVDALITALSDKKLDVRRYAVSALGKIKSEKAVDVLIAALNDKKLDVRGYAMSALGEIKSEKTVNALIAVLSDENEHLRRKAADLMNEIKPDHAVIALIKALSDEDKDMRNHAVDALSRICTIKHKELMTKLSQSDNEFEANKAYKILSEIEQTELSKTELFKKEPDAIRKVDASEFDMETNTAQSPDTGKIDPYNHLRIQNLIDLKKNIVLVDYGCGQGKFLMTMNSLEPSVKKNIQYIGVDIIRGNLLRAEFVARKNGYYVSLNNEPEFLKPEEFYKKQILVDRIFLIHTLHEIKLKYLIEAIYHISMKLRINGKILILDPNNYLDERNYVLWDNDDFKIFFSELGYDVHRYCITTNKGSKLIAADIEKINDGFPAIDRVAEKCLAMYESKKKKLREKITKGLSGEEVRKKDELYGYISKQIDEYEDSLL